MLSNITEKRKSILHIFYAISLNTLIVLIYTYYIVQMSKLQQEFYATW